MAQADKMKEAPSIALTGTATGTSSIIDTTGYKAMRLFTWGTTGTCTSSIYANAGTTPGISPTAMPNLVFLGSTKASNGNATVFVPGLTKQAVITHLSVTGTYITSYILTDADG